MNYQYYPSLFKQGFESHRFSLCDFVKQVVEPEHYFDRDLIPLTTYLSESPSADGSHYDRRSFSDMWAIQVDFDSGVDVPSLDFDYIAYASPRNKPDHLKFRLWIPFAQPLSLDILDNPAVRQHLFNLFPGSDEGVTKKTFQRHRIPATLEGYRQDYWYDIHLRGKRWDAVSELGGVHARNPVISRIGIADVGEMNMHKRAILRNITLAVKQRGCFDRGTGLHEFLLQQVGQARYAGIPAKAIEQLFSKVDLPDFNEFERIVEHYYRD